MAVSAAAAGTAPTSTRRRSGPTPLAATPAVQDRTRSTYRRLLLQGLTPEEAANLTAFVCGIPVGDVHWSLRQVNQLLFLRELARSGRFGPADGDPPRTH